MKKRQQLALGFQHTMAMFTGCVLIPLILGFNIPVALFMAGIGTLIFHLITGGKIPIFLASSGSFVGVVLVVQHVFGTQAAYGAIAASGVIYLLAALIVTLIGYKRFIKAFPPIVVAPVVMTIGLTLTPISIGMASKNWLLAIITMLTVIIVGIYAKGFFKLLPIISGIAVGYIAGAIMGVINYQPILKASWFAVPTFGVPHFSWGAIAIIAPVALVTIMEHIGEITVNSEITGNKWFEKVGLHRTLLANGITIALAGLIGAPPNTTYGENNATLTVTKQFNPRIIQIAAAFAIILGFIGKFSAFIQTIPTGVFGGISFVLFGTIIVLGAQQLISARVDLHDMRNSVVVFAPLAIGVNSLVAGNAAIIVFSKNVSFSGLILAAVVAVVLNLLLNVIFKKREKVETSTPTL